MKTSSYRVLLMATTIVIDTVTVIDWCFFAFCQFEYESTLVFYFFS